MAKKILILSSKVDKVLHKNMQEYSSNEIYYTSYPFLRFHIEPSKVDIFDTRNNLSLGDYDLVYFKQFSLETDACLVFLNHKGIPFLNKDLANYTITNKLAQYVKLGLGGYLIPNTVYGSYTELKNLSLNMEYPLIMKSINASLGRDNFLIKSHEELCSILDQNKGVSFLIQNYIENSFDYRVLILGNKLGTVLKRIRQNENDHRNNTALGALEVEVSFPDKKLVDLAIAVSTLLNKDVAGVDIIFDELSQQYYIIELNSKPCFTNDVTVSSEVPQFTKFIDSVLEYSV
jgi:glutathione synthase/RimK-type ligase-like ATP-grasp enzyme